MEDGSDGFEWMGKDKDRLLAGLKLRKSNRTPAEISELLSCFGFAGRKTKRGHTVWTKGNITLTLPDPHGREKVMLIPYVVAVIRKIEEATAHDQTAIGAEDEEDA